MKNGTHTQDNIIRNRLRDVRLSQGFSQGELAERAGVARQTVGGIEAGLYGPSLTVALRLARALSRTLEEVFILTEEPVKEVTADWSHIGTMPDTGRRIQIINSPAGYTAYPARQDMLELDGNAVVIHQAGNGIKARILAPETLKGNAIVMAGCTPVLGLLQQRLHPRFRDISYHWINANSIQSLKALKNGFVHVAGVHILDDATGEYNLPVVQRILKERPYLVFNLYHGEQGFLLSRGNPKGIINFGDLSRDDVKIVNRERGAESRRILDAGLKSDSIDPIKVSGYRFQVGSHQGVAQAVLLGGADCGVSLQPMAHFYGLDFLPLTRERYDLVILREHLDKPGIQAILECLHNKNFLYELESCGYEPEAAGKELTGSG